MSAADTAPSAGETARRLALITGASRGIGAACARALAAEKFDLALLARSADQLEKLSAECRAQGVRTLPLACDVRNAASIQAAVDKVVAAYGKIDVLVNNAGVAHYKRFADLSEADWDDMMSVNLKGAFLMLKAVMPHMVRARSGHVVAVSSIRAFEAIATTAGYSASKFGLNGLHQALAQDVREYGVRVSILCPGGVRTSLRGTSPEEKDPNWLSAGDVARAVVYCVNTPFPGVVTQMNLVSLTA